MTPGMRSNERGALMRELHEAWRAGRVENDELRAALPFYWTLDGFAEAEVETLEMFDAVGYVTDAPDVPLPDVVRVYQGRASFGGGGLAWTVAPPTARLYAIKHAQRLGSEPEFLTARVAASDVLLFCWVGREIVARRESLIALGAGNPDAAPPLPMWYPERRPGPFEPFRPGVRLQLRLGGLEGDELDRVESNFYRLLPRLLAVRSAELTAAGR